MTVIWTLPGTFGPQQTDGTKPGDTAAQQSAYFVVATFRRVLARLFSRSAELLIRERRETGDGPI
jgi:hypothetical protein